MRIYRRPGSKVYQCRYWDEAKQDYERKSTRCTDKVAAEEVGRGLERRAADPNRATLEGATFEDVLHDLKVENEARVREGKMAAPTAKFYLARAEQIARLVEEGVLPRHLAALQPRHIDAAIDSRRAQGVSAHTIAKDLIVVRLALRLAKRRGKWKGDLEEIMPERFGAAYKPRERWLPPSELWAILAELSPARAAWVAFAVATGANLSETAKAAREDVGQEATVHLRGTKRTTRDRHVPIVKPWQLALLEAALSALPKKGPLFASWTKIDRDLKLACKKAGVEPCSTNDLRRTFGTWMRADGLGSELHVAMGHVDSRMYERVYARLNPKQLAALMTVQPACTTDAHPLNACNSEHSETAEKQAEPRKSSVALDAQDTTVNHRVAGSSPAAGAEKQGIRDADPGDCAAGVHPANDSIAVGLAWIVAFDLDAYAERFADDEAS